MTDLASLVVKLEAETSQYTAAVQQASAQMSSFADDVGSSIADIAKNLLALDALKKVFDFTDSIVKSMANFEELSHAVGVTTESLSQLSFAAKLEGVDDISMSLERLSRSAGSVETGNQKAANAFAALGVSVTDASGKIKNTEQLFLDVADAVSKYNDGIAKTSAVQAIFSRGGAQFIALLDQGAAAIKAAKQEAIDLGVSVSSPAAQAAHDFEQDMTRIGAAFEGIFYKALQEVLPTFKQITQNIIDFAKNADNVQPIIEQVVTGFKVIGSVLVIVGTLFETVGLVVGYVAGDIVDLVSDLAGLAKAFADPAGAAADFGVSLKKNISDTIDYFSHPVDSAKKFVSDVGDALANFDNVLEHPIASFKKFSQSAKDAVSGVVSGVTSDWDNALSDKDNPLNALAAGAKALTAIWSGANDQLNEIHVTAQKIKPDLNLIDQTQIKAIESAINALAALDDKLNQQVATYGQSGAAAITYDLTLGKLSTSVAELDKMNPQQAQLALEKLEKQGKLTAASLDLIKAAIAAGVSPGEALKIAIIEDADALDKLKAVDALSKLDSQLLTMTGHLEEASQAALNLASRPLRISIQTAQDKQTFSGLDDQQTNVAVTAQLNSLNSQATEIQDTLGKKIADVAAAGVTAGESALQIAGEEAVARQGAIAQLETLYVKAQALANSTGLPGAIEQASMLRAAIAAIQFDPKIIDDVAKLTANQKEFNQLLVQEKTINDDLATQMALLAKQNSDGSLTDLDYMAKQDDARQHAIDQLTMMRDAAKALSDANPGNAAELDKWKKLDTQIIQLQTQMGQLAKTVRTDLTDDLTNAFVGFVTGTESAKKAFQTFIADFEKQMLTLAAKQLFQKLFETSGLSAGIDSLFGTATKTATGAAGSAATASAITTASTAAATELGTGITTAATAAATALGGGVTTGGATAATGLGAAIETSGTTAATAMGAAIETAGSTAAAAMGAAIAGGSATGSAFSGAEALALAATGGPIPAGQLTLVGEKGPELFVSDLGAQTAATATQAGTVVPDDLTYSYIIGVNGPAYIKPEVSGFVVPNDATVLGLASRTSGSTDNVVDLVPLITARLPLAPHPPPAADTILSTATLSAQSITALEASDTTALDSGSVAPTAESVTMLTSPILLTQSSLSSFAPPVSSDSAALQFSSVPAPPISLATISPEKIAAFADGGKFTGDSPILVGENGPEIIVPKVPGEVIPNSLTAQYVSELKTVLNATATSQHSSLSSESVVSTASATSEKISAFADGGKFTGGSPILVGENGPELMIPAVSGAVIPNDIIAQYVPQLSAALNVSQQTPQYPQSQDPVTYPTALVNGIDVPVGLTETFTTDSQGRTTINENAIGYVGMVLQKGTLTSSGAGVLSAGDLTYLPLNQLAQGYEPDYLAQKYSNTTLASYVAGFGAGSSTPNPAGPPENAIGSGVSQSLTTPRIEPTTTVANYAAELQSYASEELSGQPAQLPAAAYAGVGPVPTGSMLIGMESWTVGLGTSPYPYGVLPGHPPEHRAAGGSVSHDTPYLVGENGPELIVPTVPGMVIPNDQIPQILIAQLKATATDKSLTSITDRYLQRRASGGPVTAGGSYLVGENGPELMVPDSSGAEFNARSDTQNNRTTVVNQTNHFHITSSTGRVDRASQGQIAARTAMAAQAAAARNG